MRGVFYRTEKDGTPLATPELRISATNNRTVYYDNQNAKEAALQNDEIKEGSIVLTGYADGESEVLISKEPDWDNAVTLTNTQINAGYTVPADGMIVGYMTTAVNGHQNVTINGVVISTIYYNSSASDTSFASIDVVVNEGDLFKSTNINAADMSISFVPFKTVGEPLTLPVNVMNNPSLPDWGRAVAITAAQLQAGYAAPGNGFIVGNGAGTSAVTELTINNVICAVATYASGTYVRMNVSVPVQVNDIVKTSANLNTVCQISFVPFKS